MEPLNPEEHSADEIKQLRSINARIMDYINNNYKTLAESEISFEQFLDVVEISSYQIYVLALRSTLKLNKIYIKRVPVVF
ncbi:hypothetical protein INT47_010077 [Mucor saturninus]|uniref:Uncharacterized protein n=1 Tax=Mucor saturninus TaxID=64648 RepID=A0A8H7V6T2_9FUNG|nr:hypothetical protein INT47_010077 [Mucor saturninus]